MVYSQILALAALPATFALPNPQIFNPPHETRYCAVVDKTEEVNGPSWQTGRSVDGGGAVTFESGHSTAFQWQVGGEIGLSGGTPVSLAGGFGFSVAEQVTDSIAEASDAECPEGPWHCSAIYYPWGVKVSGHMQKQGPSDGCETESLGSFTHDIEDGQAWEAWVPKKDAGGVGFGTVEVCTCQNLEHWADDGHPALLCPEQCAKGADSK
ncbi:uncharacterized protein N0V89_005061 [Didymosphaeria variabile]|uniref:Uncharacterized protein n=1 Tax=Didymosphaeria variabile TaxID=1932322 RepID=A0A9W9CBE8_9PLEO|nr:uncharacterized protein N0V89_005061 [Didymosphaeria variabile]KAJ4353333.1 hypothetical protein N0V89_005061 [Didymosphaeria variabile]